MSDISLAKLLELAPYEFAHEGELLRSISELKEIFNLKRDEIEAYLKDERLVSAYLCFYFSTYLPKMRQCIDYLGEEFLQAIKEDTLIDIGAGPATLFTAISELVEGNELIAIENSLLMETCGKAISSETKLNIKWNKQTNAKDKCLFFTHSLNEMGLKEGLEYIESYEPHNIVFIEPGTKDSFATMLLMREKLIGKGYVINYPCQKQSTCPLQEGENWCHQIIKVKHDSDIERICQKLKIDRRIQPVILHWYSKSEISQRDAIIFRVLKETKFSFEWELCLNNEIHRVQIMKKTLSKKQQKDVSAYQMGMKIKFEIIKKLDGYLRIQLVQV